MAKTTEIIATYRDQRWGTANDDGSYYVIGKIQLANASKKLAADAGIQDVHGYVTAVGTIADPDELTRGVQYRFIGTWKSHKTFGMQFCFSVFTEHVAHDPASIADYLAAYGRGCGIGPSKARRLVDAFGVDDTLDTCRTKPQEVARVAAIRPEQAEEFAASLAARYRTENATLEVHRLLVGRGFPKRLTREVIQEFGNRAAEIIADDPYCLIKFKGVGFKKADALYMQLGKDPRHVDRLALALWHGIYSDNSGHTWFPAKLAVERLQREIGGVDLDFRAAILRGREFAEDPEHYAGLASVRTDADGYLETDGPSLWLAEAKHERAELDIVRLISAAREETESHDYMRYSSEITTTEIIADHTRCARCRRPLTGERVAILAGKPYGPTCIRREGTPDEIVALSDWLRRNPVVIEHIEHNPRDWFRTPSYSLWPAADAIENISEHQRDQYAAATDSRIGVLVGSPGTGKTYTIAQMIKAAVRSGMIGISDIAVGAPTGKAAVRMTETLQAAGIQMRARTWHSLLWSIKDGSHLPYRMLIGDECSMLDLPMMAHILDARAPGCHLMLVGDPNQLPPVGNGAPFRDLIASGGIGCGALTEVQRNAGEIVEACARIRDAQPWIDELCNRTGGNLHWHDARTPESQLDQLDSSVCGLDKWDQQVLVPLNDKGPVCRQEVNTRLQKLLNSEGEQLTAKFRQGDKVVCLKNGWYDASTATDLDAGSEDDGTRNSRGQLYVANGELGEVVNSYSKGVTVRLQSPPRLVDVPVFKSSASDDGDGETESKGAGCDWDLGYALSVHKAQGSEFPHVFILVDEYPGARQVCDASWVLTAASRGRLHAHFFGLRSTCERFCRVMRLGERKTFLRERIIESVISQELSAL